MTLHTYEIRERPSKRQVEVIVRKKKEMSSNYYWGVTFTATFENGIVTKVTSIASFSAYEWSDGTLAARDLCRTTYIHEVLVIAVRALYDCRASADIEVSGIDVTDAVAMGRELDDTCDHGDGE